MFWTGLVIGVVGAWMVGQFFLGYTPPPSRFKRLGRKSYAVVCAIGEALMPEGGDIPPSAEQAGVPEFVDDYLDGVPTLTRRLIHMLFFLMEHATYFFAFTTRRLSEMDVKARIRYLEGWENSRFYARRLAFTSLRAIYGMAYLAHPEVEKAMGVDINRRCREALIVERKRA